MNQGFAQPGFQPGGFQQPQGGFPQQQTNYGQNINQPAYNDKLEPVFNTGFAFNHLITIGLIHRIPTGNLNQRDYKDKYFFFVTVAPGEGQGSDRTYNFNSKIPLKYSCREISALAFALKQCAIGNDHNALPYSKFARSQGQQKTVSVWTSTKMQQIGQEQKQVRQINLTFKAANSYSIQLSPSDAFSIGEVLETMFKRGMELEMEYQRHNPQVNPNDVGYTSNGGYAQPGAPNASVGTVNQGFQTDMGFNQSGMSQPTQQPQQFAQPQPQIQQSVQQQMTQPVQQQTPQQMPQGQTPQQMPQGQMPPLVPTPQSNQQMPSAQQQTTETAEQFGQMLSS